MADRFQLLATQPDIRVVPMNAIRDQPRTLVGCNDCGAIVWDVELHNRWHDVAGKAVQLGTGNVQSNRFG
jgi:hypothetical protein